MSSRRYQGYNPYLASQSQSQPKHKHYQGDDNPFTDPKNHKRFKATLDECNQLNGNITQQQQPFDTSNPYLNDPNLQAAMQQYNPSTNKQYVQAHSARYNGHNNKNNNNNIAKSQQPKTNAKTTVTSDNPYHPTNFYKDKEAEQKTAKALVTKYRVDEINRDSVVNEYAAFLHTLPTMNMINEDVDNEKEDNNYDIDCKTMDNNKFIMKSPSNSIISNDMIPGQIRINQSNFYALKPNDRVWIRNDDSGDWEIYTVIKMEKTNGNTYIGTFKIGKKERIIWQDQCRDFTMAKFIKENENNNNIRSPTSTYIINNIFKINDNEFNGNFVLKKYNQFNGMALMKDVRTGNMVDINLNKVKHVVI